MKVLGHKLVAAHNQIGSGTTGHGLKPAAIGEAINETKAAGIAVVWRLVHLFHIASDATRGSGALGHR
jgi:hypothetical protein